MQTRHKPWSVLAFFSLITSTLCVSQSTPHVKIGQEVAIPVHLKDGEETKLSIEKLIAFGEPQAGQVVRTVSGEEADREYRRNQEIGDLYRRAAASRFVVVGKVVKLDAVADRSWKGAAMDENFGGFLYSIAIEKTVCRQPDFNSHANVVNAPPPAEADPVVYLLSPIDPPVAGTERLELGQRYLLFLVLPDQRQQKKWSDSLYLDPLKVYLRAEEQARGVVLLPPLDSDNPAVKPPEVLDKVTQLCQAMRPASLTEKLEALQKLAASPDPILSHEAKEAMQGLQRPHE